MYVSSTIEHECGHAGELLLIVYIIERIYPKGSLLCVTVLDRQNTSRQNASEM